MKQKPRSELRRQGFKLPPLDVLSLRIQRELLDKCGWEADAQGLDRAAFIRSSLTRATRNTEPPSGEDSLAFQLPEGLRAALEFGAAKEEMSVSQFVIESAIYCVGRISGCEPVIVDGKCVWANPKHTESS